jgi:hypothetical protein
MNVIVTIEKFPNYEIFKKTILQTRIHDGGTIETLLPNWVLALALCCGQVYFHGFENFKY